MSQEDCKGPGYNPVVQTVTWVHGWTITPHMVCLIFIKTPTKKHPRIRAHVKGVTAGRENDNWILTLTLTLAMRLMLNTSVSCKWRIWDAEQSMPPMTELGWLSEGAYSSVDIIHEGWQCARTMVLLVHIGQYSCLMSSVMYIVNMHDNRIFLLDFSPRVLSATARGVDE